MAKVLSCPECSLVLQRVPTATYETAQAGFDQLSRHIFEQHFITGVEAMLSVSADYGRERQMSIEDYRGMMSVYCGNCKEPMKSDTQFYAGKDTRMMHCCSKKCQNALMRR